MLYLLVYLLSACVRRSIKAELSMSLLSFVRLVPASKATTCIGRMSTKKENDRTIEEDSERKREN